MRCVGFLQNVGCLPVLFVLPMIPFSSTKPIISLPRILQDLILLILSLSSDTFAWPIRVYFEGISLEISSFKIAQHLYPLSH